MEDSYPSLLRRKLVNEHSLLPEKGGNFNIWRYVVGRQLDLSPVKKLVFAAKGLLFRMGWLTVNL